MCVQLSACVRARALVRYGEGFDYNTASADYWLIEIAAVESGLSADMLRCPSFCVVVARYLRVSQQSTVQYPTRHDIPSRNHMGAAVCAMVLRWQVHGDGARPRHDTLPLPRHAHGSAPRRTCLADNVQRGTCHMT